MLDKNLCFNLQFNHRSYVKKPMEKSKNAIQELAESLFITESDGRVRLEYPFLFICCVVGLVVSNISHFRGK